MVDPLIEKHYDYTGYAYVYNNPIKLIDPFGLDSAQRAQAVSKAQEFIDKRPEGDSYVMGEKGGPGENVDCSGLVSKSVVAGGEKDPNYGTESSGVLNIEKNTNQVSNSDAESGNIVTFRNSSGYPYHTGLVTGINRDQNGNITSVTYIHSSSSNDGPVISTFEIGNSSSLSIQGFYKWDTKPDLTPASATTPTSVATQSTSGRSGGGFSIKGAWNNFKYQVSSGLSQMENWISSGYR